MMFSIEDRALGGFLGLACGDALGSVVEFCPRGSFKALDDMRSGGKFRLPKGHWTDDTSMAICLAESLTAKPDFDPMDQMNRYYEWASTGKNSSLPYTFGIGKQVAFMLGEFKKTGNPYTHRTDSKYSGNGSLMRLMPVILRYHRSPEDVFKYTELSSKTTHATAEAIQSCLYFSKLILRIFQGLPKEQLFKNEDALQFDKLTEICLGGFKNKKSDDVGSVGYVIDSLEVALWAFWNTDNFRDAVLMAANLGDDADSNASICGQIAGAYYGVTNIPKNWLDCLYRKEDIENLTLQLLKM
ncbi:ADP-ribosylglycohydrolase [Rodentibacter ratti]|uniref:ADP-ribosylglycohydrolase n=1 Tax=Rodentibacter ratti TaxID=1906745 RepID=A0A1V3KVE0_9PAST|nr:ADP-ribosylglycohydrolase family protein [Rodentibacter ratti]OOF81278.1 ADP-ribosylglycohydrolase [Rodentibacter ratti]